MTKLYLIANARNLANDFVSRDHRERGSAEVVRYLVEVWIADAAKEGARFSA